jgi:plastocyanin
MPPTLRLVTRFRGVIKRLVVLALVVSGTLVACGKDDVLPSQSGEAVTTTTTSATATTTPPQQAKLTATEYSYAGTDLSFKPGDVSVSLTNNGKEEHQATIVRLKDGKTIADLGRVAASDPGKLDTIIDVFGGPNAVAPGATITATQTLGAGDYYFMCFIPGPDGQPHAAKGMVAPFKVAGTAAGAAQPDSTNIVALKEYAFGVQGAPTDAKASPTKPVPVKGGTVTFANQGEQLHEAAIYKPAPGKTAKDVIEYFKQQNPTGPPPVIPAGGVAALDPGTSATTTLTPGDYVFMCFLPDRASGAPHFTKGMIQAVTVT